MQHHDILDNFDFDDSFYFEEDSGEVVAKFYSSLEAEVAAARLRSEGIPCFLANATAHSVLPQLQLLIRLHVRPQDAEQARMLLAEAAIDTQNDNASSQADNRALIAIAVLIGVLLAVLLVQAVGRF